MGRKYRDRTAFDECPAKALTDKQLLEFLSLVEPLNRILPPLTITDAAKKIGVSYYTLQEFYKDMCAQIGEPERAGH